MTTLLFLYGIGVGATAAIFLYLAVRQGRDFDVIGNGGDWAFVLLVIVPLFLVYAALWPVTWALALAGWVWEKRT